MSFTSVYRSVSDLHEHPKLVHFAATAQGQFLLWISATALLSQWDQVWWLSPMLAVFLMRPVWRRDILCVGSIVFLYSTLGLQASWQGKLVNLTIIAEVLLIIYAVFRVAQEFQSCPGFFKRRPLVCLHVLLWPLLLLSWVLPSQLKGSYGELVAQLRWILPFLIWRLSYLLLSGKRNSLKGTGFRDHLWYCLPGFGGTNVPYGKGYDYLKAKRVDEKEAVARVQLAGIKLLVLSMAWYHLQVEMAAALYGKEGGLIGRLFEGSSLGFYRLGDAIASPSGYLLGNWASLISELFYYTLGVAALGHLFIGCLRLFGYSVFRNTYKPLLAETVVEFWNRFYYYFKELLVEFFFYPVFASFFKGRPKLRMFAAVMSAAFVGNLYYHIMRDFGMYGKAGSLGAIELVLPRLFYAFLLAVGVFISMQRQQKRRGAPVKTGVVREVLRIRNIGMVWLFYSLIHIWNVDGVEHTILERGRFFLSLFGLME